jgi:hypothetical protein
MVESVLLFFFLEFLNEGNDIIAYFTSLYIISDRYTQPKCSDFGGFQGVVGAWD